MLKKFLNKIAGIFRRTVEAAPPLSIAEAGKLENRFHYARPLGGFRLQPTTKYRRGHAPYHGKSKLLMRPANPGSLDCEARIRRLIQEDQTQEAAELFDEHIQYTPFNQVPRTLREWQINYKVEQKFGKEESHA